MAPLFSVDHNCAGCHNSGGQPPDLTLANIYDELLDGYVNTDNPTASIIITKIEAGHMGGMPFDDKKIILDWIYQGAKNYTKQ
ncbi:MAG: hypothetical protein R2727_03410 [Bacteroidales bacterium]